jgi:putative transcription antitermination factor YqgF
MFLGIDFGPKNIGLSLSSGDIAHPLKVLKPKNLSLSVKTIHQLCKTKKVKKIIIGLSEGKMAHQTKNFARLLKNQTHLPLEFVDETLSTQEVHQKMLQAKTPKGRRKTLSHAFVAAHLLQIYLDNRPRQTMKNMAS